MRKHLLAAVAAIAISTPAAARDGAGYIGVEGGILFGQDIEADALINFDDNDFDDAELNDAFGIDFENGFDVDLIGGYDFGMIRAEAELAYKRAGISEFEIDDLLDAYEDETGDAITAAELDLDGHLSVASLMGNVMLDFGDVAQWGGYVGGGVGRARVRTLGETDGEWAWQFILGGRTAISSNLDLGLKYRYFQTGPLDYDFADDFPDAGVSINNYGKFRSHSLLASLIWNFAPAVVAPSPPPPPPPPPRAEPAVQRCPDGSVILATDACPVPPPPPPPPAPGPERG